MDNPGAEQGYEYTVSSNPLMEAEPKYVKFAPVLMWILAVFSLPRAVVGSFILLTLNSAMGKGFEGAMEYSFIQAMPLLPAVSFLGVFTCLGYFYAALKVSTRSRESWKAAVTALVLALIIDMVVNIAVSNMNNGLKAFS